MHDRLKLLLWKVVWEVLPTKSIVAAQLGGSEMVDDELTCVLCGEHPESIQSLLLHCPFSRSIWSESPWQLNIRAFGDVSVAPWVQTILHPHQSIGIPLENHHLFQLFAANAIDMVWAARNQVVHGGKRCEALVLAHRVRRLSWEHRAAWQRKLQPVRQQVWSPPPANIVKVNEDTAIRERHSVIAVIIRDSRRDSRSNDETNCRG